MELANFEGLEFQLDDFKLLEWHIGWQQARSMLWDTWISHGLNADAMSVGSGKPFAAGSSAQGWHDMFSIWVKLNLHLPRASILKLSKATQTPMYHVNLANLTLKHQPCTYPSLGSKKTRRGGDFRPSSLPTKKVIYNVYLSWEFQTAWRKK